MKKVLLYVLPILTIIILLTYLIGWKYPLSSGNRSGKLVKISHRGKLWKTCEGTLDLGSGDNLSWDFSVKNRQVCDDLIENSGEFIDLTYKETFLGFPRDTTYQVESFRLSRTKINNSNLVDGNSANHYKVENNSYENKDAFCSLLGSIYEHKDIYLKVKGILKLKNLYLYKKLEQCNNP